MLFWLHCWGPSHWHFDSDLLRTGFEDLKHSETHPTIGDRTFFWAQTSQSQHHGCWFCLCFGGRLRLQRPPETGVWFWGPVFLDLASTCLAKKCHCPDKGCNLKSAVHPWLLARKHLLAAAFGAAPSSSNAGLSHGTSKASLRNRYGSYGKASTSPNLSLAHFKGKQWETSWDISQGPGANRPSLNPAQPQMLQSPPAVTLAPHWGQSWGARCDKFQLKSTVKVQCVLMDPFPNSWSTTIRETSWNIVKLFCLPCAVSNEKGSSLCTYNSHNSHIMSYGCVWKWLVPLNPMVNDHYPVFKWLFHWEY